MAQSWSTLRIMLIMPTQALSSWAHRFKDLPLICIIILILIMPTQALSSSAHRCKDPASKSCLYHQGVQLHHDRVLLQSNHPESLLLVSSRWYSMILQMILSPQGFYSTQKLWNLKFRGEYILWNCWHLPTEDELNVERNPRFCKVEVNYIGDHKIQQHLDLQHRRGLRGRELKGGSSGTGQPQNGGLKKTQLL